jgi:hypothetical protein
MKEICKQLYQSMLQDLEHCKRKELDVHKEIECCFHICNNYWAQLKERIAHYEFNAEQEEIEFFKTIKPQFTSQIEYYGLLSFAELTNSKITDPIELRKFWLRESMRLEKFIKKNKSFYDYYKKHSRENDEEYFLRSNDDLSNLLEAKTHDLDSRASTSHDHLVATIIALENYYEYSKQKLTELKLNF